MNKRWYYLCLLIIILGIPFRQPLLIVLGLLAFVILGAIDIWSTYCLHDLRYSRQFSEQRALYGEEIRLSLSVENAKLLPLPWLEIEDTVPRVLTFTGQHLRISLTSNSMVLENLFSPRWYERVTRHYTLRCTARGVHTFGPTVLRSGDVFGFLDREVSLSNRQYLLVYPLVVPLTRFGLPARHPFGDYRAPRRLLEDPSRVIGVRDYMYGDELRRIHWKATARTMQLQSKVYQATTTYTLVLFLNVTVHLDVHYGIHPELQELGICAAASVTDWALDEGYAVGFYANTIMYMPEEGMSAPTEQNALVKGTSEGISSPFSERPPIVGADLSRLYPPRSPIDRPNGLEGTIADQMKRRRIHLPPASNEEQRKRIMEVLARIQPYFGSSIEDVLEAERTRLPIGATIVIITGTISDRLLDTLAHAKQSGHAVAILFTGDSPLPTKMAGVTIYAIGGEDTWRELEATYKGAINRAPTDDPSHLEQPSTASHPSPALPTFQLE
jgi:uncharacterized protein (DUF58 family)